MARAMVLQSGVVAAVGAAGAGRGVKGMTHLCWDRIDPCAVQCHECAHREAACADPIVESVVTEMRARSVVGMRKYGVTLETLTHRQALRHAFEECLDAANYLQAAIMRLDGETKSTEF